MESEHTIFNYPTEQDALTRIEKQKMQYENRLVGKKFLYIYVDGKDLIAHKEISFDRKHFLHLTGLDYKQAQYSKRVLGINVSTEAEQFYERLGKDKTLINDISFIKGSTLAETQRFFEYTQHKLDNLSQLTSITAKAEFIGKYKGNQDFDIIIDRQKSALAFIKSNNSADCIYIPVSSLYANNVNNIATDIHPVLAIFSKGEYQTEYQMEYLNSKIKLDKEVFERNLTDKLSIKSFENSAIKFNASQQEKLVVNYTYSQKKYISADLAEIASKRLQAYESGDKMNEYINACIHFRNGMNTEQKIRIAVDILEKQSKNESGSLIVDEINELKRLGEKYSDVSSAGSVTVNFKSPLPTSGITVSNSSAVLAPSNPIKNFFAKAVEKLKSIFEPHKSKEAPERKPMEAENTEDKAVISPAPHTEQADKQPTESKAERPLPPQTVGQNNTRHLSELIAEAKIAADKYNRERAERELDFDRDKNDKNIYSR